LPHTILYNIFDFLSLRDVFVLTTLCARLSKLMGNEEMWRRLCINEWRRIDVFKDELPPTDGAFRSLPHLVPPLPDGSTWCWLAKCLARTAKPEERPTGLGYQLSAEFRSFYVGEWKNGVAEGPGIEIIDQKLRSGKWLQDSLHGKGVLISQTSKYEGELEMGLAHGYGVRLWKNGDKYEGEWNRGHRSGQGKYIWPSVLGNGQQDTFNGQWSEDKEHGIGEFKAACQTGYKGEFCKGERHGTGTFTYPDGHEWTGQWQKDLPVGGVEILHPSLRTLIQDGKCTRSITNSGGHYGQFLSKCQSCSTAAEIEAPGSFICDSCVKKCHQGHPLHSKKIFTVGHSFCSCKVCASQY